MTNILPRLKFLGDIFEKYIPKDARMLEVGCGDWTNLIYLHEECGYKHIRGIDKATGMSLGEYAKVVERNPGLKYDVVFSMSALFLIQDEEEVKKMAGLTDKWLITIEGETTKGQVIGRDYQKIFEPLGFEQVECQTNVFNVFGVLRVFKKK